MWIRIASVQTWKDAVPLTAWRVVKLVQPMGLHLATT